MRGNKKKCYFGPCSSCHRQCPVLHSARQFTSTTTTPHPHPHPHPHPLHAPPPMEETEWLAGWLVVRVMCPRSVINSRRRCERVSKVVCQVRCHAMLFVRVRGGQLKFTRISLDRYVCRRLRWGLVVGGWLACFMPMRRWWLGAGGWSAARRLAKKR